MRTVFDWNCRTGITEFRDLSLRNWPVQSAGAEILRLAVIWGTRHGVGLVAPIHDAVLIESSIDQIEAETAFMSELMRRASRVVLNAESGGPYELRTKATLVRHPDRYLDPRGAAIWRAVLELLAEQPQEGQSAHQRD
jgi:hypothetical protein